MTGEVLALGLTLMVHVIAAVALVAAIFRSDDAPLRDWWPGDDGRGPEPDPPAPRPAPSGGGLPLPDADPSATRLREPGRIGDGYPRPPRRPEHTPEREPVREPSRS